MADKTHTVKRDRGDDSAEEEEEKREEEGHGSDAASVATRMMVSRVNGGCGARLAGWHTAGLYPRGSRRVVGTALP